MNYADMSMGTWYPQGGMHKIIEAMVKVAKEQGVKFRTKAEVNGFKYSGKKIVGVLAQTGGFSADIVVAGADYHHIDQKVSDEGLEYSEQYWDKRKMAPSSLLYYLGIKGGAQRLTPQSLSLITSWTNTLQISTPSCGLQSPYSTPAYPLKQIRVHCT